MKKSNLTADDLAQPPHFLLLTTLLKGFLIVILANAIVITALVLWEQRKEVEWGKAPSAYQEQTEIYVCQKLFWKPKTVRCNFEQLMDSFFFRLKFNVLLTYIPLPLGFNPLIFLNYPMLVWLYRREKEALPPQTTSDSSTSSTPTTD